MARYWILPFRWKTVDHLNRADIDILLQKWNDQLIMSYCPADGRVLGNGIKPASVENVHEAVRAAKAAQREWAQTSFAERRKVLRTLLKYVIFDVSSYPGLPGGSCYTITVSTMT